MLSHYNYRIVIEKKAQKFLNKLNKPIRSKIIEKIRSLNNEPPLLLDIKKLRGYTNLYRLQVENYRIIFSVSAKKKIIIITVIGHCREVYSIIQKLALLLV